MLNGRKPDVRFLLQGTTSDRVFVLLSALAVFVTVLLLSACASIWSLHSSSDGTNVTGDFMIGEPHGNHTSSSENTIAADSEGLD